ncbi:MAG: PKD domain-containing protein [Candidatus Thermoplasmatota archaeon]|nr:PKD domain-containing protein [Candidatus Thermoplasmatota archaeon]
MNRKHLSLIVVIASILVLALIAAGAVLLSFREPVVSVTEMSLGSLDEDLKGFTMNIVLDVSNPNLFRISLIDVVGDVYLDGKDVGDIFNSTGAVIPSRGSERLEITLHVRDPAMTYSPEIFVMVEGSVKAKYLMLKADVPFSESKKVFEGGGPPVNIPPIASISGPRVAGVGDEVVFDGSGSVDTDGTITSYQWDLGDGTTGEGVMISHRYARIGTYTVRLTVQDEMGAAHSTAHQIVISIRA